MSLGEPPPSRTGAWPPTASSRIPPEVAATGCSIHGLTEPRYVANIVDQEGGPTDLRLEDLDGDGLPDLTFFLGRKPSRRYWMRNDGRESFSDFRAAGEER